jgi:hypothetical protein
MEKVESASRLALDLAAAFCHREWATLSALCCADVVVETASPTPAGTLLRGVASVITSCQEAVRRVPERQVEVTEVMSFGHRGVARCRLDDGTLGVLLLETRDGRLAKLAVFLKRP